MKQVNQNEVDLLLRALAKRRDESVYQNRSDAGDGNGTASDHLDADELNSFSEGVVPAAARARYTEHLADCDVCRRIVVNLTQAAGLTGASASTEKKSELSFWQKAAALFSPAVLRFAVPAVVLIAVIGISLAVWQQRTPDLIALNQPPTSVNPAIQPAHPASEPVQSNTPTAQSSREAVSTAKNGELFAATDSPKEESKLKDDSASKAAGTGAGVGATDVIVTSKDGTPVAQPTSEVARTYSYEPKAAAPAPPVAGAPLDAENRAELAKEQPAKREDQARSRDAFKMGGADESGPNRSAARAPSTTSTNRRLQTQTAGRSESEEQDKKSTRGQRANESETRVVSGRRFARQGNAWIDAAYDPSRTPIRVARGSEQFRVLMADEPGLRAISDQLGGVVIVVWKNRAYRIQ